MAHTFERLRHPRHVPAPADGSTAPPGSDGGAEMTASRRSAPAGLVLGALLALLLSAWAGVVPFIGSSFGFSPDGTASWTWNLVHVLGALVPGALGLLACLGIIATVKGRTGSAPAGRLVGAGLLTVLCGAWFASVPVAWPVLEGGYFHAASPSLTLAYWMGLAIGPGVLLAAFGAFTMGRAPRGGGEA